MGAGCSCKTGSQAIAHPIEQRDLLQSEEPAGIQEQEQESNATTPLKPLSIKKDALFPRREVIALGHTPNERERKKFRFFCPICYHYFKEMYKVSCCKNYVCCVCALEHVQNKLALEIPHTSVPTKVLDIGCPHCNTESFAFRMVSSRDELRVYQESPMTKQALQRANNGSRAHSAPKDGRPPPHPVTPQVFFPAVNEDSPRRQIDEGGDGGARLEEEDHADAVSEPFDDPARVLRFDSVSPEPEPAGPEEEDAEPEAAQAAEPEEPAGPEEAARAEDPAAASSVEDVAAAKIPEELVSAATRQPLSEPAQGRSDAMTAIEQAGAVEQKHSIEHGPPPVSDGQPSAELKHVSVAAVGDSPVVSSLSDAAEENSRLVDGNVVSEDAIMAVPDASPGNHQDNSANEHSALVSNPTEQLADVSSS